MHYHHLHNKTQQLDLLNDSNLLYSIQNAARDDMRHSLGISV